MRTEKLAKADSTTLVLKAEPEGKMRLTTARWCRPWDLEQNTMPNRNIEILNGSNTLPSVRLDGARA